MIIRQPKRATTRTAGTRGWPLPLSSLVVLVMLRSLGHKRSNKEFVRFFGFCPEGTRQRERCAGSWTSLPRKHTTRATPGFRFAHGDNPRTSLKNAPFAVPFGSTTRVRVLQFPGQRGAVSSTWSPGARGRALQNRKRSAFQRERADSHRKHPARSQASSQRSSSPPWSDLWTIFSVQPMLREEQAEVWASGTYLLFPFRELTFSQLFTQGSPNCGYPRLICLVPSGQKAGELRIPNGQCPSGAHPYLSAYEVLGVPRTWLNFPISARS